MPAQENMQAKMEALIACVMVFIIVVIILSCSCREVELNHVCEQDQCTAIVLIE